MEGPARGQSKDPHCSQARPTHSLLKQPGRQGAVHRYPFLYSTNKWRGGRTAQSSFLIKAAKKKKKTTQEGFRATAAVLVFLLLP